MLIALPRRRSGIRKPIVLRSNLSLTANAHPVVEIHGAGTQPGGTGPHGDANYAAAAHAPSLLDLERL
jgi:hypothetical protein